MSDVYDRVLDAEDAAVREEAARLYNALEARLPHTKYRDQLQRVSSKRLIAWWWKAEALWWDCHRERKTPNDAMRKLNELQIDCNLLSLDISETLQARGYVQNNSNHWLKPDELKYQLWLDDMSDAQLKFQHELSEWDEGRDER